MKASRLAVSLILAAAVVAPAFAGAKGKSALSADDLKQLLHDNPQVFLDFIKDNRKQVFEIISQAAQEERQHQEEEAAAAEKKDMDEAFKHPIQATIDSKTHVRGKANAKYTLVEYSDFQCPYCGRGFTTVEELRKKYGEQMRFIFKDKPLPMHPMAMPAAKWFEAVALQSPEKAWKFHDTMFQNQQKLSEDFFKQTVKDLGLDVDKAAKDAASPAVSDKINADMAEAEKLGFSGTPGFLLNGVPVRGAYPIDTFDGIIARLDGKEAKN
jgi:protein-disulfide isomerase